VRRASAALPALLVAAAALAAAGWQPILPGVTITLPRDHGAHPAQRTEWWYLTANLNADDGRELGVQLTFFRRGIDPDPPRPGDSALRARQVLAAELAVADVTSGTFRHAERLHREDGYLAAASTSDVDVFLDDWSLERGPDDRLHGVAEDRAAGIAVDLAFVPTKPIVREGRDGTSQKGPDPGNASAYLSWTRLAVTGTVRLAGRTLEVHGEGWYDHEWGSTQLAAGVAGWDWFGLRLHDGRDLMAYVLRDENGRPTEFSSATLVAKDGTSRLLTASEFSVEADPGATWPSPHTGARYPARWRIRVPSGGIDVVVAPRIADAEIDARSTTGTVYWEGPVGVTAAAYPAPLLMHATNKTSAMIL
jgi:predicted secreted hydrolase